MMNNKQGCVLGILSCIAVLPMNLWAAQPMNESALATQTGAVTAALPVIIAKAQDDAKKPEIEQRQVRQTLGITIYSRFDGIHCVQVCYHLIKNKSKIRSLMEKRRKN